MSLRNIGLITLATLYSLSSFAQAELQAEIEAETANPQITNQEVYVIQGQDQAQGQKMVSQPVTVVEASPLVRSNADQMRNARQQAEVETEQKIVEKLETSRLEDEKRRADALFGGKLEAKAEATAIATVEAKPAPVVFEEEEKEATPAQIIIIEKEAAPAPSVKQELADINEEDSSDKGRMSFSGHLGVLEYDAYNIDSDIATGAAIGWMMDNGLNLEASFTYSNHVIDEGIGFNQFQEMEQYNWSMAAKYSFLKTKIRPVVGALVGLTQRTYSVPLNPGLGEDSFDSTALDAGFLVGAELVISDNLMVGADYRNVINLTTRYDYPENRRGEIDTIEEDGYSIFSANLRFLF